MKPTTIFITYNPNAQVEQTLAIRLHTIGAVNGFKMHLPDRYNSSSTLDVETKRRIDESDWLVIFSTHALSKIVKQEIEYAFQRLHDKSKIIVIYNSASGKNLTGDITANFTEIYFDPFKKTTDEVTREVLQTIFMGEQTKQIVILEKQNQSKNELIALLGIGLGLFALSALTQD